MATAIPGTPDNCIARLTRASMCRGGSAKAGIAMKKRNAVNPVACALNIVPFLHPQAAHLFPEKFVGLAVSEGQAKEIELALLVHLELHETDRVRPKTLRHRGEAAMWRKPCSEDVSVPRLQF